MRVNSAVLGAVFQAGPGLDVAGEVVEGVHGNNRSSASVWSSQVRASPAKSADCMLETAQCWPSFSSSLQFFVCLFSSSFFGTEHPQGVSVTTTVEWRGWRAQCETLHFWMAWDSCCATLGFARSCEMPPAQGGVQILDTILTSSVVPFSRAARLPHTLVKKGVFQRSENEITSKGRCSCIIFSTRCCVPSRTRCWRRLMC